ncbi:hypothetical protein BDZ91DRAFT_837621 [Kalaharituber pfeilii]|nr:hypothetical protein BDZ91DRAFT_837621 [Kalaharituber pfeilii]
MNNTVMQHWDGGLPDNAGIYPSQYLLGRRFMMPFPGGSKNAIAVDRSQEIYIISLYTIIVTAIFTAWWILIVIAIPYVLPKHLLTQTSAHMFTHWTINEPSQTAVLMLKYWWRLLASLIKRPVNNSSTSRSNSGGISDNLTFTWQDFAITLTIVLLAAGTYVGGNVAGILLPNKFILGHAAPANPYTLYYPLSISELEDSGASEEIFYNYTGHSNGTAFRALGTVDSGISRELLSNPVRFEKISSQPPSDRANVNSYIIKYSISVTGYDMGLQRAPDLTVKLDGKCEFMYEWNVTVETSREDREEQSVKWVQWTLWPNDGNYEELSVNMSSTITFPDVLVYPPEPLGHAEGNSSTYQFALVPLLWGIYAEGSGSDPWYHRDSSDDINPGPPVLQCWENQTWSYKEWRGTLVDIQNNKIPNLQLSDATISVLQSHFGMNLNIVEEAYFGPSPLGKLASAVSPLTLASIRTMRTRWRLNLHACSAAADIQRLVLGTYIMTRDLFRNTAIDYGLWMDSSDFTDDIKNNASLNGLRMKDGQPLPGAGDFVIHTDRVTAFRFETLVALPAVLVFSWLLVPVCNWLVRCKDRKKPTEFGGDMSTAGKEGTVVTI